MPYQPKPFNLEEMWARRLQKNLQTAEEDYEKRRISDLRKLKEMLEKDPDVINKEFAKLQKGQQAFQGDVTLKDAVNYIRTIAKKNKQTAKPLTPDELKRLAKKHKNLLQKWEQEGKKNLVGAIRSGDVSRIPNNPEALNQLSKLTGKLQKSVAQAQATIPVVANKQKVMSRIPRPKPKLTLSQMVENLIKQQPTPQPTPQPTSPKWLKRLGIGAAIGGGLLGATMLWNNMRRRNKNNQQQ